MNFTNILKLISFSSHRIKKLYKFTWISSSSHCPRSYATHAKWGSLFSQYLPTTTLS